MVPQASRILLDASISIGIVDGDGADSPKEAQAPARACSGDVQRTDGAARRKPALALGPLCGNYDHRHPSVDDVCMNLSRLSRQVSRGRGMGRAGVATFTGLYLALSIVAAIRLGNGEFVFYIAVMLALIGLIWQVDRRLALPVAALWALSVWGFVHMAGGLVSAPASWPTNVEGGSGGVLYNLWFIPHKLKYDQVVHAYGFGVTTWIWWLGLCAIVRGNGAGNGAGRISEPTRSDLQREAREDSEEREAEHGAGGIVLRAVRSTVHPEGCPNPPSRRPSAHSSSASAPRWAWAR